MNRSEAIYRSERGSLSRGVFGAIQVVCWIIGIWLAVSLIGSLRWLSPSADPGPAVYYAMLLKVLLLAGFIACMWLSSAGERREQAQLNRSVPTAP